MAENLPDEKKLKALIILKRVSARVQSELLSDGQIGRVFGLDITNPINLPGEITISRDTLFSTLRDAVNGREVAEIRDVQSKEVPATVHVAGNSVVFTVDQSRLSFEHAALLCDSSRQRLDVLTNIFRSKCVGAEDRRHAKMIASEESISDDAFTEILALIGRAPESFALGLTKKIAQGDLSVEDLLPEHAAYWDYLTATPTSCGDISSFISGPMTFEWQARLDEDVQLALQYLSLCFSIPTLALHSMVDTVSDDDIQKFIRNVTKHADPFTLVGCLAISAKRVANNVNFEAIGESLIGKLIDQPDLMEKQSEIYASAFMVATAFLSEHEQLRLRPPYWRKLAGAAHASLVVRSFHAAGAKGEGLLTWAVSTSADKYLISMLSDCREEPRWRPEWVNPRYLVADVYGRAVSILGTPGRDNIPAGWIPRLEQFVTWLLEDRSFLLAQYPAILEGTRFVKVRSYAEMPDAERIYGEFCREPSIEGLNQVSRITNVFGFVNEHVADVLKVVSNLSSERGEEDMLISNTLAYGAHIAAQSNDVSLSDVVAGKCIERAIHSDDRGVIRDCIFRLIECAAAEIDKNAADRKLSHRLETLAFNLSSRDGLGDLAELISRLKIVDRALAPLLGRAHLAARVAANRL